MGQLCSVGNPSTDGCSSALEVPRGSGAGCRWGDQAEDPVRPRASRSTRSQSLGSPPRRGAGGKGVQEKVSVPTMKLSGGARSGLRLGSYKTGSSDRARPAPPQPETRGHAGTTAHAPGRGTRAAAAARRPRSAPHTRRAAAQPTAAHTRRRPEGNRGGCSGTWGDGAVRTQPAGRAQERGLSGGDRCAARRGEVRIPRVGVGWEELGGRGRSEAGSGKHVGT